MHDNAFLKKDKSKNGNFYCVTKSDLSAFQSMICVPYNIFHGVMGGLGEFGFEGGESVDGSAGGQIDGGEFFFLDEIASSVFDFDGEGDGLFGSEVEDQRSDGVGGAIDDIDVVGAGEDVLKGHLVGVPGKFYKAEIVDEGLHVGGVV